MATTFDSKEARYRGAFVQSHCAKNRLESFVGTHENNGIATGEAVNLRN
jgi:hypothetical protein